MSRPEDYSVPPLQVRRGMYSTVTNYIAATGEIVYAIDNKKVYIGDGVTPGGILVSGGGGQGGNLDFGSIISPAGFTLDLGSIN
jgi:hypothetical protein